MTSPSFKLHRPRGEFCGAGHCAGSLVDVDGWPGGEGVLRARPRRRPGALAQRLAEPALRRDAIVNPVGGPLTPPGFYYKTFIRRRRL